MTDDAGAHLDDEAVSAVLDGAGADDDARHVESCEACAARLDAFRAAAGAVASPAPPIDPARLEAAIAAALSAQTVVPLSAARSARTPPAWLGAAAAIVAVVAIGGALLRSGDPSPTGGAGDVAASAPDEREAADDAAGGTGAAADEDGADDDAMTMQAESDVAADSAAGTAPATELGELSGRDLREVVESAAASRGASTTMAAPAPEGPPPPAGGVAGTCEPDLRAADPSLGELVFTGDGTWEGEPVTVFVFEVGAERRAFAVAYEDCAVRGSATWTE